MNMLQRFRIVLFLVMVFGAFANFAQNEWGNSIIKLCQCLIGCTFAMEVLVINHKRIRLKQLTPFNRVMMGVVAMGYIMVPILLFFNALTTEWMGISALLLVVLGLLFGLMDLVFVGLRQKRKKEYVNGSFENLALSFVFFSLLGKNLHLPGAGIFIILSILIIGIPLFAVKGLRFMKQTKGERMIFKMTYYPVYVSLILFGIGMSFRILHYPFASLIVTIAFVNVLLFLILLLLKRANTGGGSLKITDAPSIFNRNVFLLFVLLTVYGGYDSMRRKGMAPEFYESLYPLSVKELINTGNPEDGKKVSNTMDAYFDFLDHCKEKGYIK